MRIFDNYLIVDWSANSTPKTGSDSIWIAWGSDQSSIELFNPNTRASAMLLIKKLLSQANGKVLVGFDFPFGYPSDAYKKLGIENWSDLWDVLTRLVEDSINNSNNRFKVAEKLNKYFRPEGPFWGHPKSKKLAFKYLPFYKPKGFGHILPTEKRLVEKLVRRAKSVWQLNGVGAVGGQVLLGIPFINILKKGFDSSVWPFSDLDAKIIFAEIYPSLWPVERTENIHDANQVKSVLKKLLELDNFGDLEALLNIGYNVSEKVQKQEGWILGAKPDLFKNVSTKKKALNYIKDPETIYTQSFATVNKEAEIEKEPRLMRPIITRLIHSCGMIEVKDQLSFSKNFAKRGIEALKNGSNILCDCQMVASGIIRRYLPADNEVIVTLNNSEVPLSAEIIGNTRSATAVQLWEPFIEGSVVAIGNAPTALFHLLELLDTGFPKPACIVAFPVGFVGAAESKLELSFNSRGCDYMTLKGRQGGSAMASAVVNALSAGLPEIKL